MEEARQADLLLHVADASNPAVLEQISAVFTVLAEIGIEEKNTLLAINKMDAGDARSMLNSILGRYPNAVPISAITGEGMEQLSVAVSDALSRSFRDAHIEMSVTNGRLMAYIAAHGEILSRQYVDERVIVHCRLAEKYLGKIQGDDVILHEESTTEASSDSATEVLPSSMEDVA